MQELQVNKENCFSVLMAVYKKEQPLFFKEALRSVFEQSLIPNEVVLVKDGPLTEELEQIIVDFSSKNEQLKSYHFRKEPRIRRSSTYRSECLLFRSSSTYGQ